MDDDFGAKLAVFNKTRLLILKLLIGCDDYMCGCDLVSKLDIPKNLLSYHIKALTKLGYIQENRCGTKKKYSLTVSAAPKVKKIFDLLSVI